MPTPPSNKGESSPSSDGRTGDFKNETDFRNWLQCELSKHGIRAWRHFVGLLYTQEGNPIKIGSDGQSDMWGIMPVKVTQEMVGTTVGIFISIETKSQHGRTQKKRAKLQENWKNSINSLGGVAIIIRPGDDFLSLLKR